MHRLLLCLLCVTTTSAFMALHPWSLSSGRVGAVFHPLKHIFGTRRSHGICAGAELRKKGSRALSAKDRDSSPEEQAAGKLGDTVAGTTGETEIRGRTGTQTEVRERSSSLSGVLLGKNGALEGTPPPGEEIDEYALPLSREIHDFLVAPATELTITLLVLTSCFLIAIETLTVQRTYFILEDTISFIFILEYLARWYSRQLRPKYLLRWAMIIDFVAILPFLAQLSTGSIGAMGLYSDFTFLRLLRILRLQRFLKDQASFQRLVGSLLPFEVKVSEFDLQLFRIFDQIFTLLFISSGLVYNAEKGMNPQLDDFFSSFYFTIITLTTVGFGDIVPVTPWGRAVTSASILVGISLIPFQLSNLARIVLDSEKDRKQEQSVQQDLRDQQFFVRLKCSVCGEGIHATRAKYCLSCGNQLAEGADREQDYM